MVSGRGEDVPQGLALPGGVVPVCLGLVSEAPAQAHEGDGGVGQAGEVAGQPAGAHPAAVFIEGHVAHVVQAVFNFPVAAVQGQHFGGAGACGAEGGQAIGSLHGVFAGALHGALAGDAEGLAAPGQVGELGGGRIEVKQGAGAGFHAPVGEVGGSEGGGGVPVEGPEVVEHGGVVLFHGHDVVAALLDNEAGGVRAAVQGVEGDGIAGAAQLVQQAPGAGNLPAGAVRVGLSQHHAVAVADGGEEHAVLVGAAGAVGGGGLAVEGEGAVGGLAGGAEAAHGPVQGVGVEGGEDAVQRGPGRGRETPGGGTAKGPYRAHLTLVQPGRELGHGGRALRPGQLGGHGNGQHAGQRVPHPAGAAVLRHLAQVLEQAAQTGGGGQRRLGVPAPPGRGLGQTAERRPGLGMQRVHQHLFRLPVRHPAAGLPGIAPGLTQHAPVGRPVTTPLEPGRVHKSLRQQHRMTEGRFHVLG